MYEFMAQRKTEAHGMSNNYLEKTGRLPRLAA